MSAANQPNSATKHGSQDLKSQQDQQRQSERLAYREGVRVSYPTWFGIAAWGLVVGVAMIKSHLTIIQALGMTLLVFAGSAQLAALPLIVLNAPLAVIFLTGMVVNLRFVIFSALLAPHFSHLPWHKRAMLGFITGDVSVALFVQRFPDETPQAGKLGFLKGLLIPNWFAWQIGSVIGIFLGSQIPAQWGVGFAGTLAILCIMLPMVRNPAAVIGVTVAGLIGLFTYTWPYKLGMLLAIVVGMGCSMGWDERREKMIASAGGRSAKEKS